MLTLQRKPILRERQAFAEPSLLSEAPEMPPKAQPCCSGCLLALPPSSTPTASPWAPASSAASTSFLEGCSGKSWKAGPRALRCRRITANGALTHGTACTETAATGREQQQHGFSSCLGNTPQLPQPTTSRMCIGPKQRMEQRDDSARVRG